MTRNGPLDGLRAIAILLVLISHAGLEFVPGGFGVTIFFVLSGYLITSLLVREYERTGQIDFRLFYLKRAVRIIPPFLIAVSAALLLTGIGWIRPIDPAGLMWDMLLLSNYSPAAGIPIPLWSLNVEEHFYFAFPLLLLLVMRRGYNAAAVFATICMAVLVLRIAHVAAEGATGDVYYWTHTRMDSILFGCILAVWNNPLAGGKTYIDGRLRFGIIGLALILGSLVVREEVFRDTFRYSVQGVGLFLLFNYVLRSEGLVARCLSLPVLRGTANLSYFLYLIHFPLILAVEHFGLHPIYGIAASILFALVVRVWVEQPLLQWRKSFERRQTLAPA